MNGENHENWEAQEDNNHARTFGYSRYAQRSARARADQGNPDPRTDSYREAYERASASIGLPVVARTDGVVGWKYVEIVPTAWTNLTRTPTGFWIKTWMWGDRIPVSAAAARCRYNAHPAPWPKCACGFYAKRTPPKPYLDRVVAEVYLQGVIVECEEGWRGQYQSILSLTVGSRFPFAPLSVRNALAVEVRVPDDWGKCHDIQQEFNDWMSSYDDHQQE